MLHTLINRSWLHLRRLQAFQCHFACWSVLSCSVLALSRVQLFATPWTAACQTPLSVGLLQARILECALPCPPPGDLPNLGIEPRSPTLQADSLQILYRAAREAQEY